MNRDKILWYEPKGRWAVSRYFQGKNICLVQDSYLDDPEDALLALQQLQIPQTEENLNIFFPYNAVGMRCPTFHFMKIWYDDLRRDDKEQSPGV